MKKQIFSTIILLVISFSLQAQTKYLNQVKYYDYRNDFSENWIYVGEGQSKSLPCSERDTVQKYMRFGDSTIELGWYLGLLATEYHITSKRMYLPVSEFEPQPAPQILIELYYALKCFDRLDKFAEQYYNSDSLGVLNGFFMRDDVDLNIREKFPETKIVRSGYRKAAEQGIVCCQPSQDQVYHLLMGLSLVKKYIPEGTKVKGIDLHLLAVEQAKRMINYLAENKWLIRNPVILKKNGKKTAFVRVGFNAKPYSLGTSRVYNYFKGESDPKLKTSLIYKLFWGTLRAKINPNYWKPDNRHMTLAIAATGNGFKKKTYRKLVKFSKKDKWYLYPLLNNLLYPQNKKFKSDKILDSSEEILNVVPDYGIFGSHLKFVEHGWTTNNYFIRQIAFKQNGAHYTDGKQYNGLDFLLFYNIWFINRTGL